MGVVGCPAVNTNSPFLLVKLDLRMLQFLLIADVSTFKPLVRAPILGVFIDFALQMRRSRPLVGMLPTPGAAENSLSSELKGWQPCCQLGPEDLFSRRK